MGWLIARGEDGKQRILEIADGRPFVAGRSRRADLIVEDPVVSRKHLIFQRRNGGDWVQDAGSRNGSQLNGRPLDDATRLADGDTISIGDSRIYYTALDPATSTGDLAADDTADDTDIGDAAGREASSPARSAPVPAAAAAAHPGVDPATVGLFRNGRRWRQVTLIGRGGMGEVYRAFDRDLAELVAVKRLRYRAGGQARLLERLHAREAAIGRTIRHPNVVRVLEDGVADGDPYMLLEWVEGRSLDRQLRELEDRGERLPLGESVEILRQLALGLAAAHAAGVVHADLKPANVLLVATEERVLANLDILESPDAEPDTDTEDEDTALDAFGDKILEDEILRRAGLRSIPSFEDLPFVGRDGELALLEQLAAGVRNGGRAWVLLFEASGVGKRRLVAEFRKRVPDTPVTITDDLEVPAADHDGLWITLLPASVPDDAGFLAAYEQAMHSGCLHEIHLQPFLRGQAIRMVEQIVHHPTSARAFVDAVERETGGYPETLLEVLRRSFESGCWRPCGTSYRFDLERFQPGDRAAAQLLIERYEAEEKGLRDLLLEVSPLGSCLDFDTLQAATGRERAALFYLVEHGARAGYLERDVDGTYRFRSEALRAFLGKRLDPRRRRAIVRRALPFLRRRLESGRVAPRLYREVALLECEEGALERGFRWYLEGALAARAQYEHAGFLDSVDAARECFRLGDLRRVSRGMLEAMEECLGPAGRGLAGLERLRRLPDRIRAKIADFGIARRTEDGAETGADGEALPAWGTPRYMSPEQIRQHALTPASDIYSLGLIARQLLDGRHPLGSLRGAGAVRAILDGLPGDLPKPGPGQPGSGLPEELLELLRELLAREPGRRPGAETVARRLQAIQLRLSLTEY